jgi:hypothetical protein
MYRLIKTNINKMKKFVCILLVIVFAIAGCKTKKQGEYTVLGDYTPYQAYREKLNGKVEKVFETNYWAVPDGESYKKRNKMTQKELDSLGYIGDFVATFDVVGDLVSCIGMDETQKTVYKWELIKKNNKLARANYTYHDTLRYYEKLKCDENGGIIEGSRFRAKSDTLLQSWIVKRNVKGDTTLYNISNYKGEPSYKVIMLYNELKQFTGYQLYDKDGKYNRGDELQYDNIGKVSAITFYDKNKKPTTGNDFSHEYDSKGNWIKVICKDTKGFAIIGERVYTYFK